MNESEKLIVSNLITNAEYTRKVLPHINPKYFESPASKFMLDAVIQYFLKYKKHPEKQAILIHCQNNKDIDEGTQVEVENILNISQPTSNIEWLIDQTEEFCKSRAMYNAIMQSIEIYEGKSQKHSTGVIPKLMQDALSVSFKMSGGHDYIDNWQERFEYYTRKENKFSFDVDILNQVTKGGVERKTLNALLAGTGVGKAHPVGTKIYTPTGIRQFGELVPGDYVFGSDGNPTKVLMIHPQGILDTYEVEFSDGRVVPCSEEHLWYVRDNKSKWWNENTWETITLKEIINRFETPKKKTWEGKIYVPLSAPVTFSCKQDDLKIDSYTLGRLIAGKRAFEKTIPEEYMYASVDNRIALLQGLLDTNGTIGLGGSINLTTTSQVLSQQIIQLVHSLGGIAKLQRTYIPKYTYKGENRTGRLAYTVGIAFSGSSIKPFRLTRKLARFNGNIKRDLSIKSIKKIEPQESVCITVEASDSLYLINEFIVTHNTAILCHLAKVYLEQGLNVVYFTMEMAEEQIGKRIDANFLGIPIEELDEHLTLGKYKKAINQKKKFVTGKLKIKEFPTASGNANDFRLYLDELEQKEGIIADIIIVDYLTICNSIRYKNAAVSSYTLYKSVAEELRGLAVEKNVAMWTGLQLNRGGNNNSDATMNDTAESFGVPMSLDLLWIIISNETLYSLNQVMVVQEKSRYNDVNKLKKFIVGMDRSHMRLYDCEESAQSVNLDSMSTDDIPIFDKSSFGAKLKFES